jgi:hypothetical protein
MSDTQITEEKVRRSKVRLPTRSGLLHHSVAWFLGALVCLFVATPFIEELEYGRYMEATLLTVVLTAAVLAVGARQRTLALACVLVAPAIIARWIHHFQMDDVTYRFFIGAFLVFLGFVLFHFLRFILTSPKVNSEVLCAAVATYLLMGLLWSSAYALVARLNSAAFAGVPAGSQPLHGIDALYFSLITLTTVGYGDITPVSGPARMLAMMEAIAGTTYMAVLIARLVSIHSSLNTPKDRSTS